MASRLLRVIGALTIVSVLGLVGPGRALADGGPIVSDPEVWAMIEEGQQTAVIHLQGDDSARVDLFVTMLDRTGRSHEVTFFVPLGTGVSDFGVVEETSVDFDEALTADLDEQLRRYARSEANYRDTVQASLLLGAFATNGLWTWAAALPLLTSACATMMAPQPVATYETESSSISVYEMDEQTDLQALIETTGLDPKVRDTLEDLRGQQIAVVQLQTQVAGQADDGGSSYEPQGQPGIHLSWTTTLAQRSAEATYTYPLGTGRAWASPIALTRVYVVAPGGSDFRVEAPQLGMDLSGMAGGAPLSGLAGQITWRVDRAQQPAFASDHAYGNYGHVWRATYVKSNSDQDITVVRLPAMAQETRMAIRRVQVHLVIRWVTWIVSLVVGGALWLVAWWLVMTRVCKAPYRWREGRLWRDAFLWSLIYPLATLGVLAALGMLSCAASTLVLPILDATLQGRAADTILRDATSVMIAILIGVPVLVAVTGLINALFFGLVRASRLNVSRARAFGAYMLVVLAANVAYAAFAVAYAWAVGAL